MTPRVDSSISKNTLGCWLAPALFSPPRVAYRLPPLLTTLPHHYLRTSISFLSFGIALAGVLWRRVLSILFSLDQQFVPLYPLGVLDAGRDAGLTHPTGPSTRGWMWVACLEAVLLVVGGGVSTAPPHREGAPQSRFAAPVAPWAGCLPRTRPPGRPTRRIPAKPSHEFDQIWPHHLDSPVVTTSQSWEEAHDHPSYPRAPDGYDVCLWATIPDHQLEPIALQTGTLAMPSPGKPSSQLDVGISPQMLSGTNPRFSDPLVAEAKGRSRCSWTQWMESDLQFRVEPLLPTLPFWLQERDGSRLSANFAANRFMPQAVHSLPSAIAGTHVDVWSITLVPQQTRPTRHRTPMG